MSLSRRHHIDKKKEPEMATTYSSPKIARELCKQFSNVESTVKVKMQYTKEVGAFIRKVNAAQRKTAGSQQVFK